MCVLVVHLVVLLLFCWTACLGHYARRCVVLHRRLWTRSLPICGEKEREKGKRETKRGRTQKEPVVVVGVKQNVALVLLVETMSEYLEWQVDDWRLDYYLFAFFVVVSCFVWSVRKLFV